MSCRTVLLVEPNYKNKYPPMGLMKLATYYRCRGDSVRFFKGDLKFFSAQPLLEEYMESIDKEESLVGNIVKNFIMKRGSLKILEYIRTGKHAPLEMISDFSRSSSDMEKCSVNNLLEALANYRNRYKNEDYPKFDRVAVTTLFTFYWKETIDTILFAKKLCKHIKDVHVGGITASLVPDYIQKETGIRHYVGLLSEPSVYDKDDKGAVVIDELPLD